MPNPSQALNPLDYPRYVRGLRPALPESLGTYVEDEFEKLQNSMENLAVASDENATAKVQVETIARQDADGALASQITTVDSEFRAADATLQANITAEATARADADDALATTITSLSATVADNTAAIEDESIARADADSALASTVSTLSTTVDGHTASITSHASSINGLEAKAGLKLDVNGHVTGYEVFSDGSTGSFIIRADRFAVVNASGGDQTAVFEVVGGQVKINGAELKTNSVTPDALNVTSLSAITATIGTLRTATSGARLEIHSNVIKVFDSSGVLRVRIGDLSL